MKKGMIRVMSAVLALVLVFGAGLSSFAAKSGDISSAADRAASYLVKAIPDPGYGWSNADWVALGLARDGRSPSDSYLVKYLSNVKNTLKTTNGVLSNTKSTEYSRLVLTLTALGEDASDFAGYDITKILGDYDATVKQGINGAIFALLALDSADYPVPAAPYGKTQATRQKYIDLILSRQLSSGGWNMSGSENGDAADPDVTAMALEALSNYTSQSKVKTAVDRGLSWLSSAQQADGGYISYGAANCESCAQVVLALCALGMSWEDARFTKNGVSVMDKLLSYQLSDGSFTHASGSTDPMATKQAYIALVSAVRVGAGQSSLYDMDPVPKTGSEPSLGLPGKDPAVRPLSVTAPGTTFTDVTGGKYKTQIESIASRGIINGIGGGLYAPKRSLKRSEFAAIVVRALGLTPKANDKFTDVPSTMWCAGYVGTANAFGIVNGYTTTTFLPNGTITRQEASAMVARAAKLCGLDTGLSDSAAASILGGYPDASLVSNYAKTSVAFCLREGILDPANGAIDPKTPILREEVAGMIFELLKAARLF